MQESFVDAAPHLSCSKVHPQPLTDRQPLSPTARLLGGRDKDGGQVTMSRRARGAHPAPLLLPKPHHHSDWCSWLSGEIQQLSCPCSATQTWLLSPHTSQGTGLQPQPRTQESCPKAQEGQHSPGCPCLAQAQRKEQDHPCTHAGLGRVHTTAMSASTAGGPRQPPTDNRWLSTGTARAGFELVPEHRKLQAPSSAPSKFSSSRTYVGKGRGVCTSSPFISGFLCCSGTMQTSPLRGEAQKGSH